jgi:imidazolonepropionase-like amidohydrolase
MPFAAVASLALASSLAITDVTVIDVRTGTAISDRTVVVTDGRIVAVGGSFETAIPEGAERVDGRGRFLLPGLCDMHVHLGPYEGARQTARRLLASGITCARDMGSPRDGVIRLRDEIQAGAQDGPVLVVAGPLVQPALPPALAANPMLLAVASAAEARVAVRRLKTAGVDFVKVSGALPRDAYRAIAEESRRSGLRFAGHVPPAITAAEAARAGQASIEHLGGDSLAVLVSCSRQPEPLVREARRILADAVSAVWVGREPDVAAHVRPAFTRPVLDTFDPGRARALFATFARQGTWQTPTLLALLGSWRSAAEKLAAADRPVVEELATRTKAAVRMMRDAGVPLLAGTDLPLRDGVSPLADELAEMVAAGLTPADALRSATSGPATFLRRTDAGHIGLGMRADLVLLEADPLQDVRNVKKVAAVVARGRLWQGERLASLRASPAP